MEDREIKKGISDLFDKVSGVFDGSGPRFFAYFGKRLVEFAGVEDGQRVLDVASGKGASLFPLAEKVGQDGEVIGIDISKGMAHETNLEINKRNIQNAKIVVMDAEKLEFSNESFDNIICGFGVFFFPNYKVAFDEFKRVLKNGGRFSFSTFLDKKDEKFSWFDDLVEKYLPSDEEEFEEEDIPSFNTEEGVYTILNESGFKNIRIVSEEKTFIYKDEQEWWDKLWTHGFIKVLEAIPEDKMEKFKSEVFEGLREMKESEGIMHNQFVLYVSGEK